MKVCGISARFKHILLFIFLFCVIFCFISSVSATNLTVDEVGYGAGEVQHYTNSNNGKIPAYVSVNNKNSTTASFLKTLTATVLQVNDNNTTPVTIDNNISSPSNPSGSVYGNITKIEYLTMARRVNTYITNYDVAPGWCPSSLGNVRYESLVYTFSKIMNTYWTTGSLPSTVRLVTVTGVTTGGVVVQDSTLPTVTATPGSDIYNSTQSVTLMATDNVDSSPNIYYTTDGSTPTTSSSLYTSPIDISSSTVLKFIGVDDAGNQSDVVTSDYVMGFKISLMKTINYSEYLYDGIDPSWYYNFVMLDDDYQFSLNESGNFVTVSVSQVDDPFYIYIDNHLREIYMSVVNVYVDDVLVLARPMVNGGCLQPSWFWARHIDSKLLTYFPEYDHSQGVHDFVGYDLPYIYSLNNAYYSGDTALFNEIWQTILDDPNITDGDIYFIEHHRFDFVNPLFIYINYPDGNVSDNVLLTYVDDESSGFEYLNAYPVAKIRANDNYYGSIQSAIDSPETDDGDVIYVDSGVYVENITIDKKITLTSVSGSLVVLEPRDRTQPVITINDEGSGSIINCFTIVGATCASGILLNSTQNCIIIDNYLTQTAGIRLRDSDNNTIMDNTLNDNSNGISLDTSSNNTIYANNIFGVVNVYAITLIDYSMNNVISGNDIENNCSGIFISNSSGQISGNTLKNNEIHITDSIDVQIIGNDISSKYNGSTGIYLSNTIAEVHYNRITGFTYGIRVTNNSTVDTTNNWWGSNTVSYINSTTTPISSYDIWNNNSSVTYDPWLVLNVDSSTVNSSGNTSVTGDLTHNSDGDDTSTDGHVPNGIPINFTTNFGTITGTAYTVKGRSTTILDLGTRQTQNVNVSALIDDQTISTQSVIATGMATVNITSTAINNSTGQPVNLTYSLPLDSTVTWVSALWRNTYVFYGEMDLIVNGTDVETIEYVNPAYLTWRNSISNDDVFRAIIYTNYYLQGSELTPSNWNKIVSFFDLDLNDTESQFVQDHYQEFTDTISITITYPGVTSTNLTVTDPSDNSIIDLNFTGNVINRTSTIIYMDGEFNTADYEGVKSFAIATTKITDGIAQYWADQKDATDTNGNLLYPDGYKKAAYGTFFSALMLLYCHDILADAAASEFNVTWSRTSPIIVSVGDDAYQTYVTLECDHTMGMTVVGTYENMWNFNYACSSSISIIEYGIMNNLSIYYQYVDTDISGSISSVTRDMLNAFWNGSDLEIFTQNGYVIMKLVDRNDLILVIDPETGIMRDLMLNTNSTTDDYYGVYCFHKDITDLANDFFNNAKDIASDFRNWADNTLEDFNWVLNHLNRKKLAYMSIGAGIAIISGVGMIVGAVCVPLSGGASLALFIGACTTAGSGYVIMLDHMDDPTWV